MERAMFDIGDMDEILFEADFMNTNFSLKEQNEIDQWLCTISSLFDNKENAYMENALSNPERPGGGKFKCLNTKQLDELEEKRLSNPRSETHTWSLEANGDVIHFNAVTSSQLDELLRRFYAESSPKHADKRSQTMRATGPEYYKNTLNNISGASNRHFKDIGADFDIVRDESFEASNNMLDSKLKSNLEQSLTVPTTHKAILSKSDVHKMSTYLNHDNPNPIILRYKEQLLCEKEMSGKSSKTGRYEYTLHVKTGDRLFAGTDANVYCILNGVEHVSKRKTLNAWFKDDFKRGQVDTYNFKQEHYETVESIDLWRDDTGVFDGWNIDTITVMNETTKTKTVFPVFRWIRAGQHYTFIPWDTFLPQADKRKEKRKGELNKKRDEYRIDQNFLGPRPEDNNLPPDEKFSWAYEFNIKVTYGKLKAEQLLIQRFTAKWDSINDMKNVYSKWCFLPKPVDTGRWDNDVAFGLQRIAGVNNCFITLLKQIPEKIDVTNEMLKDSLNGLTLSDALSDRRIFIVDYHFLKDCPTAEGTVMAAPIALFFRNDAKKLVPIAIQLYQDKDKDNPVFLPSDPKHTWIMAKMWFNNADTGVHQAIAHLGFTHLLMEGVAVVTHRNLSQSHPLFKLLAPHFLYLIAINNLALGALVEPAGFIDKNMTIGCQGLFEVIRRYKRTWRLDVEGTLPEDLKSRGVDDLNILPEYHFRDDALLLYECIKSYVMNYINLYYQTDDDILEDWELQSWRREMTKADDKGGLGILGVAGEKEKFTKRDQVVQVLCSVIYTCSVAHAASNFKQYDEYAFQPNYPAKMTGTPPKSKSPLTEKDLVDCLPDKPTTLNLMILTHILSQHGTKSLGDFEVNYIVDPKGLEVVEEFRANLKRASDTMRVSNKTRDISYHYLYPAEVPNSISI